MSDHESTYVPKSGVEKWLDTRLPIIRFGADYMSLPTPTASRPATSSIWS